MSNGLRSSVASDKYGRVGPDYFAYYSSEVVNLLSQDEDALPASTQTSELSQNNRDGEGRNKNMVNHGDNFSGPLYSNGVGAGLSDFKKDRLRSLLRQSVIALSSEVDEVVDPVFAAYHLQSNLRGKIHSLNHTATASDGTVEIPGKKLKLSSSSSASFLAQSNDVNLQCSWKEQGNDSHLGSNVGLEKQNEKVNDIQFLSKNDSAEVEDMVKKYSNELSRTLGYMEQQLESLLNGIMSKCRSMTLAEKQQLQSSIQKLPARNLDRVVEILCQNRPIEEQNCKEIFVDLEKEDNTTLWRLHYYVEAVEKATSLCCNQEA